MLQGILSGMGVPSPESYLLYLYSSAWTLTSSTALLPSRRRSAPTTVSTDDAPIVQGHTVSNFYFCMTFKDKLAFENIFFGHFNSRRLEFKYIFERRLVFKRHDSKLDGVFMANAEISGPCAIDSTGQKIILFVFHDLT
jgi:hypothetical protein